VVRDSLVLLKLIFVDHLNQAMHDLRQSIDDNAKVKASSAYINEDPTEQHNYDQAVQHAQDIKASSICF
jgi:hypothetical protein